MALIKCPECGNSVSSTAEQCIHCGYKFRCCPECGEILVGAPESCGNCGFIFEKEIKQEKASENVKDVFMEWMAEKQKNESKRRILLWVSLLLCLSTVVILGLWKYGNPVEALFRFSLVRASVIVISVASAILYFVYIYRKKNDEYADVISLMSFMKKNDLDGTKIIKEYSETTFMGKTVDQIKKERELSQTVLTVLTLRENVIMNARYQRFINFYCFLSFVTHAVVEVFMVINIIGFIDHALWLKGTYFDSFKCVWLLAVGMGAVILRIVLFMINDSRLKSCTDAWLKKDLPEYEENFKNKIIESAKHII